MDQQLQDLLRDLKEELDKFDFQKTRFDDQMVKFEEGMKQDIADGLYKNTPEDRLQQLIKDEKNKLREKYNNQNNELSDENSEKLKGRIYNQISSAIKNYHLDMVLEVNKANRVLANIETERKSKLQEIDQKIEEKEKEKQEKINEIDKKIAQIEAKKVHLMYYNSENQLDAERDMQAFALVQEINELKSQRDSISNEEIDLLKQERNNTEEKYNKELKEQSDMVQHYDQQKERASKFLGSIRLSEKSIDEIYKILFGKEEKEQEGQGQEGQEQERQGQKGQGQEGQGQEGQGQEGQGQEGQGQKGQGQKGQGQEGQGQEGQGQEGQGQKGQGQEGQGQKGQEQEGQGQGGQGQGEQGQEGQGREGQGQGGQGQGEPSTNNSKNFTYKISKYGIRYDNQFIYIPKLLDWYEKNKEDIKSAMKSEFGEKEDFEDFLEYSDKFIYLSMLYKGTKKENDVLVVDEETKSRLGEYYDIWTNPKKQEKSNMQIEYDLKGMNFISRLFKKTNLTNEQVAQVKENAFLLRKRKDVQIRHGVLSRIEFFIKDRIESAREMKLLNAGQQQNAPKENTPSWQLTEEQLEHANEPIQETTESEKDNVQQKNSEER